MLVIGVMLVTGWHADANLITNGSFENQAGTFSPNHGAGAMQLYGGSSVVPGWNVDGGINGGVDAAGIAWESSASGFGPSAGSYFLNLAGVVGPSYLAGVTLAKPLATVVGQIYALSFDLGSCSPANGDPLAPIVRVTLTGQPGSQFFTSDYTAGTTKSGKSSWQPEMLTFRATSAFTYLSLDNSTGFGAVEAFIGVDNVSVEAVPDAGPSFPAVAALFLIIAAGRGRDKARQPNL